MPKKNLAIAIESLNAVDLISESLDKKAFISDANLGNSKEADGRISKSLNEAIQQRANTIALLAQAFGELGVANIELDSSGNAVVFIEVLLNSEYLRPNQRLFLKIVSQKSGELDELLSQTIWVVLRDQESEIHFQFMNYKGISDGLNEKLIAINFDEINRLFQKLYGEDDLIEHAIISGSMGIREFGDRYLIKTGSFSWLSKKAFYVVEELEIETSLDFKSISSIKMMAQAEVFVTSELIGFIDININNSEGGIPKLDIEFRTEK
ncbi:MAG: hypothetical protein KBD78_16895 [Oligoflexales bacterium]|nr:hypothetical protein [Oligoflexales bacterium]